MKRIYVFCLVKTVFSLSILAQTNLPFDVQHYRFNVNLTDSSDLVRGSAVITVKALEPLKNLSFDLKNVSNKKGMTVQSVYDGSILITSTHKANKLVVTPLSAMEKGEERTFTINYSGIPGDGLIIAKNKYGNRTFFSDNWPNRAHNWLPCVDHPADKASVEFIVTAPNHYQVVSNGILVEESDLPKNKRVSHWKEDVPLPTKIMVIGVAKFAVQYAGSVSNIPVYSWVYPENRKEGFYDYEQAKDILPFFINYIGPYAYQKLANVQSKTIFGGMENASTIFYSEGSVTGKRTIEGLLAHEIAHQWFGNMASEKNFSHLWLSEGFATYFTNLYLENKYGKEKMIESLKEQKEAVIEFSKTNRKPVVDTGSNYMALLNANSYQKGAWVLHMLRMNLGDDTFQKVIRSYYEKYSGKNADTEDFMHMAEEISGKHLEPFFTQWLYTPGQPDLDITWSYVAANNEIQITVTQKQTPLFSVPIYIQFKNAQGESPIQMMQLDQKQQSFSFQVKSKPENLIADPEMNVLAQYRIIEK